MSKLFAFGFLFFNFYLDYLPALIEAAETASRMRQNCLAALRAGIEIFLF